MSAYSAASAEKRLSFLDADDPGGVDPATVGAKAANLMRLTQAGLAVPSGFVLSTDVCAEYHARGRHLEDDVTALVRHGVEHIERSTGLRFGASRRPLLVAVRSGAPVSMPGMLDTVLDVGLSRDTLPALVRATGDPMFAWDSYRRLIQSYADVVEGCPSAPFRAAVDDALRHNGVPVVSELDVHALRDLVDQLEEVYRSAAGRPLPQNPMQQLLGAVEAVLRSWNADRAIEYRRLEGLTGLAGTAVTVQAMVFGNMGATSGAGVGFTRDPATGHNRLYVDFLLNAQGEDVVGGRHSAGDSEPIIAAVPGLAHELHTVRRTLERAFGDAQDFEFTVEDGKLWLLQTRTAKRTPWAALQIACDLVDEGVIDQRTALDRLGPYDLDRISRTRLAPDPGIEPIGRATPASAGVATGAIALDGNSALRRTAQDEPVILVRDQTSTDDIAALAECRGLLAMTGARTSHAAVVARQLGVVCLVDCGDLAIDVAARSVCIGDCRLDEGDTITIDGADGRIYPGAVEMREERPSELIDRVRGWQQRVPA